MILRHYTHAPLVFDPYRTYEPDPHHFKPRGLWLSVVGEDDWKTWCESEGLVESLLYATDFEICNGANILHLDSFAAIKAFDAQYANRLSFSMVAINWGTVAARYDGIIIAPYQWSLRLDPMTSWYYPWDCASGCVWNLSAIRQG